jgi:hypothetical protein
MADLERVLQQLQESDIDAGVQTSHNAGMRVWIGDEIKGSGRKRRFIGQPLLASYGRKRSRRRVGYMRPRYVYIPLANTPKSTLANGEGIQAAEAGPYPVRRAGARDW